MVPAGVKKFVAITLKVYIGYVVVSVALAMPLLNIYLGKLYADQTGRHLDYQLVGFNPFTLALFAYGLKDTNADNTTLWSMRELQVNPSLAHSVAFAALGIDEIRLLGLVVKAEKTGPERFNFSDILDHQAQRQAASAATPTATDPHFTLPRIWIGEFELDATLLQYTESRRDTPFQSGLRDFNFTLKDFSTLSDQGHGYQLQAESAHGGRLTWQGDISAPASRTWGHITLENFSLLPVWQFMEPQLNFNLTQGKLSLGGDYELSWSEDSYWQVKNAALSLNDIALHQKEHSVALAHEPSELRLDSFHTEIASIDGRTRTVKVASLLVDGLFVSSSHQQNRVDLVDMLTLRAQPNTPSNTSESGEKSDQVDDQIMDPMHEQAANQVAITDTPAEQKTATWAVVIEDSRLQNAAIHWRVPELDDRILQFDPIAIRATHINSGDDASQFKIGVSIDQQAQIALDGTWQTASKTAHLALDIDQLPLAWANPLLKNALLAHIETGLFSASSAIDIRQGLLDQNTTQISIEQFSLADNLQQPIAKLAQLTINDVGYIASQQQLNIAQIEVQALDTRIHIRADGSTNLNDIVKPQPSHKPETVQPAADNARALQWQIKDVNLVNARIAFTDQTPLSTFKTHIQDFGGHISSISSQPEQALEINLAGNVDGYAPVAFTGWAKPLLQEPAIDLALNFTAMDLGVFNPYSTTFTGYPIEKGLLTVEFNYQLEDRRIVGQNRVVLDQLTLGERVQSLRLIDLPIRFALALLTDEHGIVDLQVPVSGSTDDPAFDIGAVIWTAVRNSIMHIVTAPFNLLAALAGSEEDLGKIDFPLYQATLDPAATQKLASLKIALDKRPQLRVGIIGDVNHELEALYFKEQNLTQQLLDAGIHQNAIDTRTGAWLKYTAAQLNPEADRALDLTDTEHLHQQLLRLQPEPQAQLHELAQARAIVIKQALIQHLGLDADRVFVKSEPSQCPREGRCQQAQAVFSVE